MKERTGMESRKPRIGYACAYTPLALIDAAGFQPYRILPKGDCPDQAGHVMHDNMCPHVKKILDRALDGDIPGLDGIIFMNSCDAMRRLYDAWVAVRPNDRAVLIDLPVTKDESSVRFFAHELSRLYKTLSLWSGQSIPAKSMKQGLDRYNEIAQGLSDIKKRITSGLIKGGAERLQEMYNYAATESFDKTLDLIKQVSQEQDQVSANGHVPLYIFGNVMPDAQVFSLFESCGASIVGEDLCTGSRLFSIIKETGDENILYALAEGLLNRPPCARTIDTDDTSKMARDIMDRARDCGARGIIGHTVKFCDPYIFRMPALSGVLRKEGIPFLALEGDCTMRSIGQHRTRIEAFIEMLR